MKNRSRDGLAAKGLFHQEVNGSKLSLHWLAQLSENPVEGVCGRSLFAKQKIFRAYLFVEGPMSRVEGRG